MPDWRQRLRARIPAPPWRAPRPETGPIRLHSRRLYILPTGAGILFAALLIGLLWGSINYGLSLGYLFTFLLAGIAGVAMWHTQRNLAGLVLRARPIAPVFAGETARICLHVDSAGRPRAGLMLRANTACSALTDVDAEDGELCLDLAQPRRGFVGLGPLQLDSRYPLGLFRCWSVFAFAAGVLVYPRPAAAGVPWPEALREADGEHNATQRADDLIQFDGLRAYQPGDGLRRIAWKQSARGDSPISKQFSGEDDGKGGGEYWLDWRLTPETETEARLSRLCRWALDAEASDLNWGLRLPGASLGPGRGAAHLHACLAALARHGAD